MLELTTPSYTSPVKIHKFHVNLHETDLKHKAVKPRKSYSRASALGKAHFCRADLTITSQQKEESRPEPLSFKVSFAQHTWRTSS